MQVQQFVAGREGDCGTLVLQLHFDAVAKDDLGARNHAQQSNLTGSAQDLEPVRFCIFQMVPWYFRLLFHTMHFKVDDKVWGSSAFYSCLLQHAVTCCLCCCRLPCAY